VSGIVDEQAQPLGFVQRIEQSSMQVSPHAHSQTTQHPVESSWQLASSSVSAVGKSHIAQIARIRSRALTARLYTLPARREDPRSIGAAMKEPLVILAVAAVVAGCADRPFLRAEPPVEQDGVTVSLAGQRCGRRTRHDLNDVLDLVLAVRVTNTGPAPVTIVPTRFLLVAGGEATAPDGAAGPMELSPGEGRQGHVHYHQWGSARCNSAMTLALADAVERGGEPLPLPPLTFVPEGSDR
jgi:hypothetical protein